MLLAPRHLSRLAATAGLFTSYGLAEFAREQGLDSAAGAEGEHDEHSDQRDSAQAAAFSKRLVELGPAYVKLGQLLSSRPDLLPDAYIRELERLQDAVAPVPYEEIAPVVEEELGGRISKLFSTFEQVPLGSASLGQAHAATLLDGREVVVKVQRPGIQEQLADDIDFFRELAEFLSARTAAGRRIDLVGIIDQLQRALVDELDYRIEARNAAHFRRAFAEFPRLLTPRVIANYSARRVLTTERIHGVKVTEIPPVERTEIDFAPLADELVRAYLKQIAIDGHFHADPHPGNVFVTLPGAVNPPTPSEIVSFDDSGEQAPPAAHPDAIARDEKRARDEAPIELEPIPVKLALIDFGMTARLSPGMRRAVAHVLFGLSDGRGEDVAEALMTVGEELPDFDRARFTSDVAAVIAKSYRLSADNLDVGMVLYDVINAAFRCGLRPPAELTLLAKALAHLGVVARTLDPNFEPLETVRAYMGDIAVNRANARLHPRQLLRVADEAADFIGVLPRRLDVITRRLANNEFQTRLDFPQITVLLEGLQKVANRVFTGLVLAGVLVASAMLLPERPALGTTGFILAGSLGLFMIAAILISDRRREHRGG